MLYLVETGFLLSRPRALFYLVRVTEGQFVRWHDMGTDIENTVEQAPVAARALAIDASDVDREDVALGDARQKEARVGS